MIRRFNFTERKRIDQERVQIEIIEPRGDGPASFQAALDFNGLDLPLDSPVTIEAYRGRAAIRFSWGRVGTLTPPLDRRLANIPGNPSFRVKVIAPDGSGVLLAMANHIRPKRQEHQGSLIWLEERDLGKEVWQVDFGDGSNPTLLLNSNIADIGKTALSDGEFRGLVFPAVLRSVLIQALIIDDADPEDEDGPWGDLMVFVHTLYDEPMPLAEDGDEESIRMAWIEAVVAAFTRKHFRASDTYTAALARS